MEYAADKRSKFDPYPSATKWPPVVKWIFFGYRNKESCIRAKVIEFCWTEGVLKVIDVEPKNQDVSNY